MSINLATADYLWVNYYIYFGNKFFSNVDIIWYTDEKIFNYVIICNWCTSNNKHKRLSPGHFVQKFKWFWRKNFADL